MNQKQAKVIVKNIFYDLYLTYWDDHIEVSIDCHVKNEKEKEKVHTEMLKFLGIK
jgi:hypothetical protein